MEFIYLFEDILRVSLRVAPPLILAGIGATLTARVGILNMALEGLMLIGAFSAVVFSYYLGDPIAATIIAAFIAMIFSGILAYGCIDLKANNVVVGLGINTLALGITTYFLRVLFGVRGAFASSDIVGHPRFTLSFMENLPVLRALSGQTMMVYISLIVVAAAHLIFYKTPVGLHIRGIGDNEAAIFTAGVNVKGTKYGAVLASGFLAGLAGAHLSLGQLTLFTENMTDGRGFMALAASTLGNRTPLGTALGGVLFSFAEVLKIKLQATSVPPQLLQMTPYFMTIISLVLVAYKTQIKTKKEKQ